jgi:hypothetical protein
MYVERSIPYRKLNTLCIEYNSIQFNAIQEYNPCVISDSNRAHKYTVWAERRMFEY